MSKSFFLFFIFKKGRKSEIQQIEFCRSKSPQESHNDYQGRKMHDSWF